MAAGDIVSGIATGSGTTNFQPSATTEIMLLSVASHSYVRFGLYNGVTFGGCQGTASGGGWEMANVKIGITNTNYLQLYSDTDRSYSGIQIK